MSPDLRLCTRVPWESPELRPCTRVPLGVTRIAPVSAPPPAGIPVYPVLATAQRLSDAAPRGLIQILRLQEAAVQQLCRLLPVGKAGGSQTLDLLRGVVRQHVPTRLEYHNRWQLTHGELAPEVPAERAVSLPSTPRARAASDGRQESPKDSRASQALGTRPSNPPSGSRRLPLSVSTCCMYLYCFPSVQMKRGVLRTAISNSEAS